MPLVFVFVLGLAFLLMLFTFRSIVIPIKAIVLNLLSVGAAYGVLVIVFQNGAGESLLGFESNGGVTNWLPVFLFVILFGLSMDYHVFILTRVRELYDRGMSTDDAVREGISRTAGTVTSAAVVMVAVFGVFATLSFIDFKQMGVGLAFAILIDATVIRGVLLPATMKLLGDWNWYLPRFLQWIPDPAGRARRGPSPQRPRGRLRSRSPPASDEDDDTMPQAGARSRAGAGRAADRKPHEGLPSPAPARARRMRGQLRRLARLRQPPARRAPRPRPAWPGITGSGGGCEPRTEAEALAQLPALRRRAHPRRASPPRRDPVSGGRFRGGFRVRP